MTPERQSARGSLPYLDDWAEYLRAVEGRAPATVVKYREVVEALAASEAIEDPAALRFEDVERHLRGLYAGGYSTAVRARAVSAIRGFCRYLGARGLIEGNPVASLRRPRVYVREPSVLRRAEIEKLVYGNASRLLPGDALALRNRVMWYVMYIAGLRAGEVGELQVDQLRWEEETRVYSLLIRWAKASTNDVRQVLDPDASRLIATWLPLRAELGRGRGGRGLLSPYLFPNERGGPLRRSQIQALFRRRVLEAGVKAEGRRLSPHTLRHSIATHLLTAGWDVRDVRDYMRHSSIATTELYLHGDRSKHAKLLQRKHPLRGERSSVKNVGKAVAALVADLPNL